MKGNVMNKKRELESLRAAQLKTEQKIRDLESELRNGGNCNFDEDLQSTVADMFFEVYDFVTEYLESPSRTWAIHDIVVQGIQFEVRGYFDWELGGFEVSEVSLPLQPNETPRETTLREMLMNDRDILEDFVANHNGCDKLNEIADQMRDKIDEFKEFVECDENIPEDTQEYFYNLFYRGNLNLVIRDAPAWFRPYIREHKKSA